MCIVKKNPYLQNVNGKQTCSKKQWKTKKKMKIQGMEYHGMAIINGPLPPHEKPANCPTANCSLPDRIWKCKILENNLCNQAWFFPILKRRKDTKTGGGGLFTPYTTHGGSTGAGGGTGTSFDPELIVLWATCMRGNLRSKVYSKFQKSAQSATENGPSTPLKGRT